MSVSSAVERYRAPKPLRLIAYCADWLGVYAVTTTGGYLGAYVAAVVVSVKGAPPSAVESAASSGLAFGTGFWFCVSVFMNFVVLQGLTGSTLGKMITGTRVVNDDGSSIGVVKSFWRTVLYVPSIVPLNLGFLSVLYDPENRCWHDRVCETQVVRDDMPPVVALPAPEGRSETADRAA